MPGVYTSIFAYNSEEMEKAQSICPLYFDLDSSDSELVQKETIILVNYLAEHLPESVINIYFSGGKGFHVEVEPIALGITPKSYLPKLMRYIGTSLAKELHLTTVDSVVWEQRRMWRMPNTQHQKTGLFKVQLTRKQLEAPLSTIREYAKTREAILDQPQFFNAKANEWFREWDYKLQEPQTSISLEERIKRFSKQGSTILKDTDTELIFNPMVFERCHALNDLWKKAEETHNLTHEERLFLLSILNFTNEAIEYLKAIVSNCDDWNEEITNAHIQDWIKRRELGTGGRPFSCQTANSYGVGCGDCSLEPKERLEKVGDQLIPTGELAPPSPFRFAYERKKRM